MPSEILESTIFPLKNIAMYDGGRAFEAEIHTHGFAGGAFTKTLQEGQRTRPLLQADGFLPVGHLQLTAGKGGLRVHGRMIRSEGSKALIQPGVALELRYKVIHGGSTLTEVRLFSVAITNSITPANTAYR